MPTDYTKRILIPFAGDEATDFFTLDGTLVATGYSRIVIGGRGPYVEFDPRHIYLESLHLPELQEWRTSSSAAYYVEYRTTDKANVKFYHQLKPVDYADYVIGRWYASPFLLKTEQGPCVESRQPRLL